ncbi:hypothetical protein [Nocardia terpenica]|uniref:Uncharacterized protein n=1 Tax=Nocardia terpenica TaxID=455432 RepID=A0A6G9YZW8_9NOCA|nr:hypothetical protein [Nocardia terpenica]QIS18752.1 hypothetical protein F6W96_11075 [Nocardia terpenica]
MSTPNFNYGQSEIKAFNDAASGGVVHFEESAVRQAVGLYDKMINGLKGIRLNLTTLEDGSGFGGFDSGRQLQSGFSRKAADGIAVIDQLIDGAMQLQEAYLRAGGLFQEADKLNGDRIKIVGDLEAEDRKK